MQINIVSSCVVKCYLATNDETCTCLWHKGIQYHPIIKHFFFKLYIAFAFWCINQCTSKASKSNEAGDITWHQTSYSCVGSQMHAPRRASPLWSKSKIVPTLEKCVCLLCLVAWQDEGTLFEVFGHVTLTGETPPAQSVFSRRDICHCAWSQLFMS